MDTVTAGKTLEQKIYIAAGYDAERVGLIKELLVEVAGNAWDECDKFKGWVTGSELEEKKNNTLTTLK